jgi:hypothetical protein
MFTEQDEAQDFTAQDVQESAESEEQDIQRESGLSLFGSPAERIIDLGGGDYDDDTAEEVSEIEDAADGESESGGSADEAPATDFTEYDEDAERETDENEDEDEDEEADWLGELDELEAEGEEDEIDPDYLNNPPSLQMNVNVTGFEEYQFAAGKA